MSAPTRQRGLARERAQHLLQLERRVERAGGADDGAVLARRRRRGARSASRRAKPAAALVGEQLRRRRSRRRELAAARASRGSPRGGPRRPSVTGTKSAEATPKRSAQARARSRCSLRASGTAAARRWRPRARCRTGRRRSAGSRRLAARRAVARRRRSWRDLEQLDLVGARATLAQRAGQRRARAPSGACAARGRAGERGSSGRMRRAGVRCGSSTAWPSLDEGSPRYRPRCAERLTATAGSAGAGVLRAEVLELLRVRAGRRRLCRSSPSPSPVPAPRRRRCRRCRSCPSVPVLVSCRRGAGARRRVPVAGRAVGRRPSRSASAVARRRRRRGGERRRPVPGIVTLGRRRPGPPGRSTVAAAAAGERRGRAATMRQRRAAVRARAHAHLLSAGQRGHPAAARRAVVEVLLGGLVAPVAEPQGLDGPWQAGLRRGQRQHLPDDLERLARVVVRVDLARARPPGAPRGRWTARAGDTAGARTCAANPSSGLRRRVRCRRRARPHLPRLPARRAPARTSTTPSSARRSCAPGHEVHLLCQDRDPLALDWVDAAGDWDGGALAVDDAPRARARDRLPARHRRPAAGLRRRPLRGHRGAAVPRAQRRPSSTRYLERQRRRGARGRRARAAGRRAGQPPRDGPGDPRPRARRRRARTRSRSTAARSSTRSSRTRASCRTRARASRARAACSSARATPPRACGRRWTTRRCRRARASARRASTSSASRRASRRRRARAWSALRDAAWRPRTRGRAADAGSSFARDAGEAAAALATVEPGDRLVVFVGKLIASKGVELLLAAWPLVLAREPRGAAAGRRLRRRSGRGSSGSRRELAAGDLDAARADARRGRRASCRSSPPSSTARRRRRLPRGRARA